MKIAITGGTGFVGRHLAALHASAGDTVRILSREHRADEAGVRYSLGDLCDANVSFLQDWLIGVDVLYHCAGELNDETKMQALHVEGTSRLIQAARGRVKHWVQLSSCGVYGPVRAGTVTEESPLKPAGIYEETKLISEQLALKAATEGAFTVTVLRPSNIYGEDMPNESLRGWLRMVKRGLFFFIGQPGATANYVHVDDVVNALYLCSTDKRATDRIYNLSAGCTIEVFVQTMCHILGRKSSQMRIPENTARLLAKLGGGLRGFPLKPSRIDALTGRASYSSARILRELNFKPRIDVEEGLSRMIRAMASETARYE